jgi:hypothetical protein
MHKPLQNFPATWAIAGNYASSAQATTDNHEPASKSTTNSQQSSPSHATETTVNSSPKPRKKQQQQSTATLKTLNNTFQPRKKQKTDTNQQPRQQPEATSRRTINNQKHSPATQEAPNSPTQAMPCHANSNQRNS